MISTQATAAFVRGISAHIARRKESATLLPGAMEYLLDKVRTKPNKHTGCKMCPVCKRDFEDNEEAQKTIERLDKVVKKHQQGVGAAELFSLGDLWPDGRDLASVAVSLRRLQQITAGAHRAVPGGGHSRFVQGCGNQPVAGGEGRQRMLCRPACVMRCGKMEREADGSGV